MNRNYKCACALAFATGLFGCPPPPTGSDISQLLFNLADLGCTAAPDLVPVPQAVPPVLSVVRNDPARFAPADHPLKTVSVGTVIDDLSGLDGCWGRFIINPIENSETGEIFQQEQMEVLVFDVAAGRITRHSFTTRPPLGFLSNDGGGFPDSFFAETPFFLSVVSDLRIISDNIITTAGISSEEAAIEPDGRLVFDCGAATVGSINDTATLTGFVTLQGNFLKKSDSPNGPGQAPAVANDELAELWVRFDCAEQ